MTYCDGKPLALAERKAEVGARFIWSTRGAVILGDRFDDLARRLNNVDEAEVAALRWIEALSQDELAYANGTGIEITTAGWSQRAGDLAVFQFGRKPGKAIETAVFDRGVYLSPTSSTQPPLPSTVTDDQFVRLALAQWKIRDRFGASLCIGGCQHITTATRSGVTQRLVGVYPDYDDHAATLGDPNAEAVAWFRGERGVVAA